MCLKKIGMILSRSYKVENLYVGLLGYVTKKKDGFLYIDATEDKYIIYRKEEFDMFDYVGKDLFTNKEYFFWNGNLFPRFTIHRAVDNYAIYDSFPIEQFFSVPKSSVKKVELLELYNQLNKPKLDPPKEESEQNEQIQITDSILKTILETNELVKKSLLDEQTKKGIVRELDELAQYYISEMTKVNEEQGSVLTLNDEYSIRMEVIKSLANIEARIKNPNVAKSHRLKMEYNQFKSELISE